MATRHPAGWFALAVPLYQVEVFWQSINSYDGGFTTWPVDYIASVNLAEGDTVFDPMNEFQVELLQVDTSNQQADALVTTHLCGCTHAFSQRLQSWDLEPLDRGPTYFELQKCRMWLRLRSSAPDSCGRGWLIRWFRFRCCTTSEHSRNNNCHCHSQVFLWCFRYEIYFISNLLNVWTLVYHGTKRNSCIQFSY